MSLAGIQITCPPEAESALVRRRWNLKSIRASPDFPLIKSYIPFSPQVCGGLVLYFSFTLLSIVLGLFLQPLHSGLFIFLYRHLYRLTSAFTVCEPPTGEQYGARRCSTSHFTRLSMAALAMVLTVTKSSSFLTAYSFHSSLAS